MVTRRASPSPNLRMNRTLFHNGTIVLEDRLLPDGVVEVEGPRHPLGRSRPGTKEGAALVDLQGGYLVPGFIDLHVHGGDGADFMDGTEEAFRTVCRAHARHGTTSLLPTTTVARHEQHLAFLDVCRRLQKEGTGERPHPRRSFLRPLFWPRGARLPSRPSRSGRRGARNTSNISLSTAFAPRRSRRNCPGPRNSCGPAGARGIRCNAGHSHATFEQMEAAVGWGVRHIDHLFCAMSDRARLRQTQTYPMRGGVMEATLYFDELTTEVIADGKHLQRELLLLAYKIKGPDRLALVTDCNRALDLPDGEYIFGPLDGGEPILRRDGVGSDARRPGSGLRRHRHGSHASAPSTA